MEESETESGEKKVDEPPSTKKKVNDEKSKYENINGEQELLGSVTTINNPGLRTSARVIQKMKQDSIRPSTPPPPEKKEGPHEKGLPRTPSQTRPPKVTWSNIERNLFFDAINEFGKDFESIANFINSKIKRKNVADQSCCKTKEQVRQMYYQSFHKISKYLKFSDDVKKPAQELYALINYGEMRRKLQFVSEKNCMKIKDLVYKGHVTVRSKGKNIRIKTPPCKALRKLNQLDDWQQDINLPAKIEVCLKPANMDAWARVQSIAQNPLVQTTVPLQKKLVNVIKTFQMKWRNEETKLALQAFAMGKQNQNSKHHDATKPVEIDQSTGYQEPLLCLCPPSNAVIHKPLISVSEFLSSFSICLNSYEQKIGVKVRGETLFNKRQRSDSSCEKKSPESKKIKTDHENVKSTTDGPPTDINDNDDKEPKIYLSEVSNSNQSNPDEHHPSGSENRSGSFERHDSWESEAAKKIEIELLGMADNAVSCFMSPEKSEEIPIVEAAPKPPPPPVVEVKSRKKDVKCAANKRKDPKNFSNLRPLLDEETEKKIRKGWTISNASDISVGDLYITFGHDSKITFEYYWLKKEVERNPKKERSSMPYNVNSLDKDSSNSIKSSSIGNKLKHLLLLASLTERVKRKPCSCGHVCEKGAKHKKGDNETGPKTYISNKTYSQSNDCLFRQPVAPFRRPGLQMENIRMIQNGFRYNHARLLMKSRSLPSKEVVVQRLLPVQPGMNQSYDVVTPQVHVRTIVEKPTTSHPHPAATKIGLAEAKISSAADKKESTSTTVASITITPKIDVIVEPLSSNSTNSIERPFKTLGNNNNKSTVISSNDGTVPMEDNSSATSITLLSSLSSPDSVFASNNSNDSGIVSNGTPKLDIEDPGIQQLMDISLPSPAKAQYLDDSDICSIPSMSPMRLLRESSSDPKWLEENLNDFSLSSFLGHLEDMNRDVDTLSVMSETSQDYMTKFAEIAASMQNEDKDL